MKLSPFELPTKGIDAVIEHELPMPLFDDNESFAYALMNIKQLWLAELLKLPMVAKLCLERLTTILTENRDLSKFITCVKISECQWIRINTDNQSKFNRWVDTHIKQIEKILLSVDQSRDLDITHCFIPHEFFLSELTSFSMSELNSLNTKTQNIETESRIKNRLIRIRSLYSDIQQSFCLNNESLTRSLSRSYITRHNDLANEIHHAARYGIYKAVNRYAPELGYSFNTIATRWVKASIYDVLNTQGVSLLSDRDRRHYKKIQDLMLQGISNHESLADQIGITVHQVYGLLNHGQYAFSLDQTFTDEYEDNLLAFKNVDDSFFDHIENAQISKLILKLVNTHLNPRDSTIIRRRYGLGCEIDSLTVIGNEMGVTGQAVHQFQRRAEKKLAGIFADSSIEHELKDIANL